MIMSWRTEKCWVWKRFYLGMKTCKMFLSQQQQEFYYYLGKSTYQISHDHCKVGGTKVAFRAAALPSFEKFTISCPKYLVLSNMLHLKF